MWGAPSPASWGLQEVERGPSGHGRAGRQLGARHRAITDTGDGARTSLRRPSRLVEWQGKRQGVDAAGWAVGHVARAPDTPGGVQER